jgi:TrbB protein
MNTYFTASLQGKTLSVYSRKSGNDQAIAILALGTHPRFYIKDNDVYHDSRDLKQAIIHHGTSSDDAQTILCAINTAVLRQRDKQAQRRKLAASVILGAAVTLAFFTAWNHGASVTITPPVPSLQHVVQAPVIPVSTAPTRQTQPAPADRLSVASVPTSRQAEPAVEPPKTADYQKTAEILRKTAQSGQYTIALSSGHARTLYVFADPLCHNCQIIEPALEALSEKYNIEIFPVTLVGKQQTLNLVSPILCQAPAARLALWKSLFRADAGLAPGETASQSASCEAGETAVAKNDVAFDYYTLPGTPSLLADDGRYIPLQSLKSDDALEAFLNSAVSR